MKTRLAGIGLIALGIVFAVLFVYLPVRDGPSAFMGSVPLKALVFVPLAVVAGAAFVVGGPTVLGAFQARPKSRGQLALVLSIIVGSGALTAIGYWQLKTRWLPPLPGPVIIRNIPQVPQYDTLMARPRPPVTRP